MCFFIILMLFFCFVCLSSPKKFNSLIISCHSESTWLSFLSIQWKSLGSKTVCVPQKKKVMSKLWQIFISGWSILLTVDELKCMTFCSTTSAPTCRMTFQTWERSRWHYRCPKVCADRQESSSSSLSQSVSSHSVSLSAKHFFIHTWMLTTFLSLNMLGGKKRPFSERDSFSTLTFCM